MGWNGCPCSSASAGHCPSAGSHCLETGECFWLVPHRNLWGSGALNTHQLQFQLCVVALGVGLLLSRALAEDPELLVADSLSQHWPVNVSLRAVELQEQVAPRNGGKAGQGLGAGCVVLQGGH